jgi:hypothetical protein
MLNVGERTRDMQTERETDRGAERQREGKKRDKQNRIEIYV